ATEKAVNYAVTNKNVSSMDLSGWNTTTETATLPDNKWTGSNVSVTANSFAASAPTTNKTIFSTDIANFFGKVDGDLAYKEGAAFSGDVDAGVTFSGTKTGGVKKSDDGSDLNFIAELKNVKNISLGKMTAGTSRDITSGYDFSGVTSINASGLTFTNPEDISVATPVALLTGATGLLATTPVTGGTITQSISNAAIGNGITGSGTLTGEVTAVAAGINYTAGSKTLSKVNLSNWNGTTTAAPEGWTSATGGIAVDTGTFGAPSDMNPGDTRYVLTAPGGGTFSSITGDRVYKNNESFKDPSNNGVTLEGLRTGGVQITDNDTKLTYTGLQNNVSKITLGTITSTPAVFGKEYSFTGASVDASSLSFSNPENIGNGDNVTLFTSANSSLPASTSSTDKDVSYSTTPIPGVTISGQITGSYSNTSSAMTYNATGNNASKLTFGNVEWKDTGALIDHSTTLTKVSFDGANVDTSNINFTNIKELEANKQMTLVSSYGGNPASITGSKYKVGSTLQGEGQASMDGDSLIFTADTTAEKMQVQEQTHNTLMGASASMASLSQGNEFIGATMDEMFLSANVGRDGIASYAHIGGGALRQETGSHINTRTWNAIVALGHRNKKPLNTFEYGAFLEYGTGNYTTHNGDERGDGSSRYVGGGLLAKWTVPSGLYVEGSLRAGTINDDAHNLLRDVNGVPYSYKTDAPYYGFHVGVGKKIAMKGGNELDLYAKYLYNHRKGVSFDAGGHYDLDGITSQIIRVGTRYTLKREKWNFYGGLAYEYELDGKAGGWADGMAIRGVDTSGGSFRGELGATVTPNEDIPLTLEFNLTGFAGKKRGLFGGVGLRFNF
uniref:autotransporter outer membrane beta-barrel domain-containing protein n=1 Tax=Anaerovibrio lipolyticus TaxID=82374 RepID=UPI0023F4EB08